MNQFSASSFTVKSDKILRALITDCGIFEAFKPTAESLKKNYKHCNARSLWDTGATGTVITKNIVDQLALKPIGKVKVFHANGEDYVNTYMVNIMLPNNTGIPLVKVTEGKLNGIDVLIGMDIISKGDFSISNTGGKTIFSFQIPSTHEIDFVEETKRNNHTPMVKDKLPGRNDSCHCGSGKKYKNCHGR